MMKKLIGLLMLILLSVSCEKDTKLSEFVVGNWKSQTLNLGDSPLGYFEATIKADNTYVLKFTLSDGSMSLTCPAVGYTIDNGKSQITIEQPTFDPATPATGTASFDVEWNKDSKVMTWVPVAGSVDSPPTLVWTRQ
jgi:hypothetical protein